MKFNRKKFWDNYREEFGRINQAKVGAIEFLLDNLEASPFWKLIPQIAYALATIKLETANTFEPITERGARAYFDKYDNRKSLGNTEEGDGFKFRGRGFVQITGRRNYELFTDRLGKPLTTRPEQALFPDVAFDIMTDGMHNGLFTGKKLTDYITKTRKDYSGARRIINGTDKADLIASYAESFEQILKDSLSTDNDGLASPTSTSEAAGDAVEIAGLPQNNSAQNPGAAANKPDGAQLRPDEDAALDKAVMPAPDSTQTADQITNIDTADKTAVASIDAALAAPAVEIEKPAETGFLGKVWKVILGVLGGTYVIPKLDLSSETVELLKAVLPYLATSGVVALVVWYITKKINNFHLTKLKAEINTDVTRRDIKFVEKDAPKLSFWQKWGI